MDRIHWLEWTPEAFEKARKEDKLILLDIGAGWCHWCHVMDVESYDNPAVIKVIEERYVPIRVESDGRPDINERYNQGGWPSTVLLSHDGFLVHGATYLPPAALEELLVQAKDWYDQNKKRVSEAAAMMAAEASRASQAAPEPHSVKDLTDEIIENMMDKADRMRGGFGDGAKFPQSPAISLLLAESYFTANEHLLEFAEKTLQGMTRGLLDKEEGGMFRYCVSPEWGEPHYEKNLDVNSQCLRNYLDAYRLTGKREYADTSEKILEYLRAALMDPDGGFSGSQDADVFDAALRRIVVTGEHYYSLPIDERRKHGTPRIDKTLYVNWNALAISSLIEAYHVLEHDECLQIALKSLHRLMKECVDDERGVCHYLRDGRKGWPGFFTDIAALARANLDAYETTAEGGFLKNALRLMEIAHRRYAAPEGGFYDAIPDQTMPPATNIPHKSLSDNMLAVEVFARLYNYTADSAYLMRAASTLAAFEKTAQELLSEGLGYFAAEYALAAKYAGDLSTKVAIIGSISDERARKLLHEARKLYRPAKIVQFLDPQADMALIQAMKYPLEDELPVVHICTEKGCAPPVRTVEELLKLLNPE